MDVCDSFKLHTNKCIIFAYTANETKLTDIFKINIQDHVTRDMEDVALHVLKARLDIPILQKSNSRLVVEKL